MVLGLVFSRKLTLEPFHQLCVLTSTTWTTQLPGKQLLKYFKLPFSALQKLEISTHISCRNRIYNTVVEQLLQKYRHACPAEGGRADSWGQELLQPSPSKPPPVVTQRPHSLPLSFPVFQPDPEQRSHP